MKIAITTIRSLESETLASYCEMLRDIGIPYTTRHELLTMGSAQWTSVEPDGGVVTTTYECLEGE